MSQQIVHIQAQLRWDVAQTDDGGYVAKCDTLKLVVEGDTFGELNEMISDALDTLLQGHLFDGGLEDFLHNMGWSPTVPMGQINLDEGLQFDVPYSLMHQQLNEFQAGTTRAR